MDVVQAAVLARFSIPVCSWYDGRVSPFLPPGAYDKRMPATKCSCRPRPLTQAAARTLFNTKARLRSLTLQSTHHDNLAAWRVPQVQKAQADEQLASAQRLLPAVESQKRAAAAKRDFREAARLSAEARSLAAAAEAAAADASHLGAALSAAEGALASVSEQLAALDGTARGLQREAAAAAWRCLRCGVDAKQRALEAAIEGEEYGEAEALQVRPDVFG